MVTMNFAASVGSIVLVTAGVGGLSLGDSRAGVALYLLEFAF